MNKIAPYGKALTGAIVACLSYLQPAIDDGLTPAEMIGAAVAFLTGLAVVWAIPNRDPDELDPSAARGYGSGVK